MAANASTNEIDWGDGVQSNYENLDKAKGLFEGSIEDATDHWPGYEPVLLFSSPDRHYWRHDIFPEYKAHRGAGRQFIQDLRDWAAEEFFSFCEYNLEADDLCGILATGEDQLPGDDKVVVSIDKDMLQIPGLVWNPRTKVTHVIHADDGDRWHMYQTLVGDQTDGYPGLRGVGDKKASAFLEADGTWAGVFEMFENKGWDEEFALLQARLARILQAEDWSWETKEVRLWEPPTTE